MSNSISIQAADLLQLIFLVGLPLAAMIHDSIKEKRTGSNMKKLRSYAEINDEYIKTIGAISELTPFVVNDGFETTMKQHSATLNRLIVEMAWNSTPTGGASDEIKQLKKNLTEALVKAESFNSPLRENRKLLYQEAGQWARHFSTVRMTVMTFTITTCVAIIAWKWQTVFVNNSENSDIVTIPVGILWLTGVITFWVFTYHTYKQISRQMEKRPLLPASFGDKKNPNIVLPDFPSFIIPLLTGVFVWLLHHHHVYLDENWRKMMCGFIMMSFCVPIVIWLYVLVLKKPNQWQAALKAIIAIAILLGLEKIAAHFDAELVQFARWIMPKLINLIC